MLTITTNFTKIIDKIIEWGIIFLIVFTPLSFGTVHYWAYTLMELIICFLVLIWIIKLIIINLKSEIHNPQYVTSRLNMPVNRFGFVKTPLNVPILLFIGLVIFQLIPLPPGVLKSISPNTHQLYQMALPGWPEKVPFSELPPSSIDHSANNILSSTNKTRTDLKSKIQNPKSNFSNWKPISIYPYATKTELYKVLAYIGMFLLISNTPAIRTNRIIIIIIGVAFSISFLGILQKMTGTEMIFWIRDASYATPFGVYINRNHFAGYVGMAIPLSFGFLISRITGFAFSRNKIWRSLPLEYESHLLGNIILIFATTIMIAALFFSLSRGGILSFAVVTVVFAGFVGFSKIKRKTLKGGRFVFLILLITFCFLMWLGLGPILNRLSVIPNPRRIEVSRDTINMAKDFPLFGTGLGTFQYVYPGYKTLRDQLYYDHAHNDYVEQLSDIGIVGFIIVSGGLIVFLRRTLSRWWERRDPHVKGITLGGICSILSISLHSCVDFNLHIPANALFVSLIFGLTYNTINQKSIQFKKKDRQGNAKQFR